MLQAPGSRDLPYALLGCSIAIRRSSLNQLTHQLGIEDDANNGFTTFDFLDKFARIALS